jgi:hypothetical protein
MMSKWRGLAVVLLLGGCAHGGDPVAAPTSAVPSSSAPSSSVPSPSSSPSGPPIPASVPASAFLQAADAEKGAEPNAVDPVGTPSFCGATFASYRDIGIRKGSALLWQHKASPEGSTPAGTVTEMITVYRGAGATTFMADLRQAVAQCPSQKTGGLTRQYKLLGSVSAGQDSVLVEDSTPAYNEDGTPRSGRHYTFWAAARVADSVALVKNEGWEDASADRTESKAFAQKAAKRLAAWRS